MKTRLFTTLLLFLAIVVEIHAQDYKGFRIDASVGISAPMGDYKSYTKTLGQENEFDLIGFSEELTGQAQFKFDVDYNFNKFGIGATFGLFNHKISGITYEVNFPVKTDGGKITGTLYGIGPNYTTSLGALNFSGLVRAGILDISLDKFIGSYNGTDVGVPVEILNTELSPGSKSFLPYTSFGVKLSYPFYKGLSAFVTAEYLMSFGDGFEFSDKYVTPHDINDDGNITAIDIEHFVNRDHLVEETRFIKPQALNVGFGLSYGFGDTAKMPVTKDRPEERKARLSKSQKIKNNDDDSDGDGFGDDDFTDDLVFENVSNKRKRRGGNVVVKWPINNSHFTDTEEVEKFSWELLDDKIENPKFRLEIFKIGENRELRSVHVENTSKTVTGHEAAHVIQQRLAFSLDNSGEGHFRWAITETTTGITSKDMFFSISACDFNFSIDNETIECVSSTPNSRTLKICFDSVFSSTSPLVDLTFFQQQSGLILYDQNINALTYQLISPYPQPMLQSGTGGAITYCLEVIVPNGVTSVTLRMQGDEIISSGSNCIPLAELSINSLPYCTCDDCANKNLVVNNLIISQNGSNSNQFNISADLSGPPIYGIEFQIQSYGYAAMSPGCTDGVTTIEESGMFLIPATTINNSPVAMYNESVSSSANTNDLATKTIQYMSTTPITGTLPVNLTIGLPGPAQGQDTSTCRIYYKICIKAKVYFDDGSCTSCVFSDCFTFDNQ